MSQWPISSIGAPTGRPVIESNAPAVKPDGTSFGQWLNESLQEVNRMRNASDDATRKLITGESKDIHNTMIQAQKAGIAMDLVVELRNKVIAAYEEIKRMQF
ncbi:flagellar hook-basal body complex protein FliE [Desulfatitalea alkaliphila]|uniref:Flagellar hook-basal body complex protein FliE n=1 Tax=Desulfatitalea alkaliphila TaxID=2929485 RepID=A0AA41UKC7_9BACT|nr:flagellar hook-basal body complex protein FliE [Desulfatitalea alkaliphila]MCJ8501312.1 flagellar hook-basal body complex protein FliE [Desulfatitalea alkaliphila]